MVLTCDVAKVPMTRPEAQDNPPIEAFTEAEPHTAL